MRYIYIVYRHFQNDNKSDPILGVHSSMKKADNHFIAIMNNRTIQGYPIEIRVPDELYGEMRNVAIYRDNTIELLKIKRFKI